MSYQVLSRKWRPQIFDDLVGQSHITKTLKNAISKERVAHGFLFCGLRGVGKTTTARIFSKVLNCLKPENSNPCNKCKNCSDITDGRSLDVLEIDGASNRGIDEIRELREAVKYPPSNGKYRIYIIDEVHMLTTHAFNALLKTLEEPPSHVKFILATTDPQKLPQTILSRTLRFEFKRVKIPNLIQYIRKILDDEQIIYDDLSLVQIVKKGDGSVRDTLSILDQAIAYTDGNLQIEEVQKILGVISESLYCEVLSDIINKNNKLLNRVHIALNEGVSISDFITGLNHFLNGAMLIKSGIENSVELGRETIEWINNQDDIKVLDLLRMVEIIQKFEAGLRHMKYPQLNLDSILVKLLSMESTITISEILEGEIKKIPKNPFPSVKLKQKENYSTPLEKDKNKNESPIDEFEEKTEPIEDKNKTLSTKADLSKFSKELDLNFFSRNWNDFLEQVEAEQPKFLAYLSNINLKSYENGKLVIQIRAEDEFNAKGIQKNQVYLEKIFKEYSGETIKLILEITNEVIDQSHEGEIKKSSTGIREHPLFETIIETFDGEIVRS